MDEFLIFEVVLLYKNVKELLKITLKENGITFSEYIMLRKVKTLEKSTYYTLSKALPDDNSSIFKIIRRLENKKIIERLNNDSKKEIQITSKGNTILKKVQCFLEKDLIDLNFKDRNHFENSMNILKGIRLINEFITKEKII